VLFTKYYIGLKDEIDGHAAHVGEMINTYEISGWEA
jgi:hypothetical protein